MSKTKVELNGKNILVTGSPGFIGANLVMRLLNEMNSGTVILILSILVDTFSSRISLTMPPSPKPHNTACVLS